MFSIKKVFSACILSLALTFVCHAKEVSSDIKVVLDTYRWFNQIASEKRESFTQEAVAKHFSQDAKMITNDKLVCTGIKEHYDHFIELNDHYAFLHVDVDKIDARQCGDRVYLHYTLEGKNAKNEPVKILVMGYMIVKNNRVAYFNEVIA
ncbi:MAG: hypothetical protein JSS07_04860 [Proteobacteria bacterium]|nr:hypothetical protein [Pseudomonadota bacterium]